ncbi:MarC family protein [Xanthobacter autotrophicus]|uniref:MarC family protein n=1 Tax=Xanthobacter TaxID=279 RepID=UPI0024AA1311|nr:MarC family protein [Xanthobacter autotrophicus]MDI4665250.1 MarC family protein [Xanthobacter autotrophicus]
MIEDLNLFASQLVTLWVVLEPFSHLSLFLSATSHLDPPQRHKVAGLALVFAFLILVVFTLLGRLLLQAMGISILAFQISGGMILFLFAMTLIFVETPHRPVRVDPERGLATLAVYPLATPILAGPGAILAMVLFSDNNRGAPLSHHLVTMGVLALMMTVLFVVFLLGDTIARVIGQSGASLLRRVMGILLAALSVNLVLNAFQKWLGLPEL